SDLGLQNRRLEYVSALPLLAVLTSLIIPCPRTGPRESVPLRYVGVRPIDSEPVDGPPSSAHSGRNRGGRTISPALRAGRAFARNLRKPTCGYAAIPIFRTSVLLPRTAS